MLGNEKVVISRKRGYEELVEIKNDDSIAEDQPTKFVIEITTGKRQSFLCVPTLSHN